MKSVFRNTCIMATAIAAMFIFACAKHPTPSEPVMQPQSAPTSTAPATELEMKKIIVAKVNNVDITMDALINSMNNLPPKKDGSKETLEERKARALDIVILHELAYQRATSLGLNADSLKIDLAVSNFKQNLGGETQFADYLTRHSITEAEHRAGVERDLTIHIIYTKEVEDVATVPEDVLKNEYETKKPQFIAPEKIIVTDVSIKDEGKASMKRAQELLKNIKADKRQDPWNLILDGTFIIRKTFILQDKDKVLYDAAKKMKPQELSGVIKSTTGLHIIRLESNTPEKQLTFEEATPLMNNKLKGPYVEKKTHEWEQELKKSAKIEIFDTPKQEEQKKP